MQSARIAGLQIDLAWEDASANCSRVATWFDARPPAAGSLVVLPEMFSSGFSLNPTAASQPPGGGTERFLMDLARRHRVQVLAGLAVAYPGGDHANEAMVIDASGTITTRYRKQRPFCPGQEHVHYPPGGTPARFTWEGLTVAPFICYDLRFPELFRAAARLWRPEIFTVVASWPDKRILHWVRLLQARAIENQAYVIGVNRVGTDPQHRYVGRSVIVNPHGEIIADAGESEGWIDATLDLQALRDYRQGLPFLDDLKSAAI